MFTRHVKVQSGRKRILIIIITKKVCRLWRTKYTSPFISSFIDRVFPIFRWKMYGFNPLEMDIKVLIPAPAQ